jgi:hypothetical protein
MEVKNVLRVQGRLFPPIISKKQLTTVFLDAPRMPTDVSQSALFFVYANGIDQTNVKESICLK